MCVLIVELQINHMKLGSQPGSSFCSPVKCVALFAKEYCVVIDSFWKKCTDDQSSATKQEQANLCAVTVLCAST